MKSLLVRLTNAVSTRKGAWITLAVWLILVGVLSGVAKPAKQYAVNVNGSGLPDSAQSVIANEKLDKYFSAEKGTPALIVFTDKDGIKDKEMEIIGKVSEKIKDNKDLEYLKSIMPFSALPLPVKQSLLSEDGTTLLLPVLLEDDMEMKAIQNTIKGMKETINPLVSDGLTVKITGPAGIAADTLELFSKADVVLLLSTVGLILILLIVIYRSPLLAILPLLAAGLVHQVVDCTLGLLGKSGLVIESQSLSIMSILLFAALTDYALFVFARYKEELRKHESKHTAMKNAMAGVGEPIAFSACTVLAAMLVLFVSLYKPYQNFAPIFSITMFILMLAGLTLLPALFTLFGRKAFWPAIPKTEKKEDYSKGLWWKLSSFVTKHYKILGLLVVVLLAVGSYQMKNIEYSFNLIKSFPSDMESRQGYEILEEKYNPGDLAPTSVLISSDDKALTIDQVKKVREVLLKQPGVQEVTPDVATMDAVAAGAPMGHGSTFLVDGGKLAKLELTFKDNPYTLTSIEQLENMRNDATQLLKDSGLNDSHYELYFAGETAKQADVKEVNQRDTWLVVLLVTILITLLLIWQTRSLIAPLYMIGTILLSYCAAMGIGNFFFQQVFDIDAMSYRIPLYTFVFLVALGVDYSIMLISRIQEEMKTYPLKEAVQRGLAQTGGVISSAGLILAATFSVLTTQPIMELFLFGFIVAVGILLDTFLVRTILVPAIINGLGKWSFWPYKIGQPATVTAGKGTAFRAVENEGEQKVEANQPVLPVIYSHECMDVNDVYDPDTATFIAKEEGMYSITASVAFSPEDANTGYRVAFIVQVNEKPVHRVNAYYGPGTDDNGDVASVAALLPLKAGDAVQISLTSTVNGTILPEPISTHFAAVKLG